MSLNPVVEFITKILSYALTCVVIFLLLVVIRKFYSGPFDPLEILRKAVLDHVVGAGEGTNVEYRTRDGSILDLGSFMTATLQNSQGKSYELKQGYFRGCDPKHIKAGASCHISIQGGLLHDDVRVQIDDQKQTLFVQSRFFSRKDISEQIGGRQ